MSSLISLTSSLLLTSNYLTGEKNDRKSRSKNNSFRTSLDPSQTMLLQSSRIEADIQAEVELRLI